MSREAASSSLRRCVANSSGNPPQDEANENEFQDSLNSHPFPPPRTPLNAIPVPSQYHRETQDSDFDSRDRLRTTKKLESFDRLGVTGSYAAPRASSRHGKPHSEPNSAQSTPARSASTGAGGATGTCISPCPGPRITQSTKRKDVSSFSARISRSASVVDSNVSVDVQHFDLDEDPRFWEDHNVQVLIRIRPLSTMERVSPGYGRCLRQDSAQTLAWLGHPETRFTFDHIACETISQEILFRVAGLPMVENCLSGYNSCMFAYGQTGSGKTYTMMGEINQMEGKLSEDCGITPRIFDFLFSRIKEEEDSRMDENLKFSCKCSFLEIYNEQITDLLDPSSLNLQLREDLKNGVYVENLTEYNVRNVDDVIKLLLQGAANRKIAATHMNSESSRSHSVFTCIIESWWEKDSTTHFRFARLNLVDLTGSERQKSSGAEGDRLKEAANINKSLSTLGLVIMSLVDLAHGKHRHVPYRDSRLTFLLQDSLGGNSKTTIIANVSPSICSAHETLSTLKFAQRAKLIRNNAKVNEDASGDVSALQQQIQQLKDQLSFLTKHNLSRPPSSCVQGFEQRGDNASKDTKANSDQISSSSETNKMKCMEAALFGALRREKMAENSLQKLKAEIEHKDQLACQKEEDMQHTKMMLRFQDEKIKQLELLLDGSFSADHYLVEENKSLKEEIELLQTRIDRSPKLTHFALENIRHLEQLQLFQIFNEQGERDKLLAEISDLRDQLLEIHGRNFNLSRYENQDNNTKKELEDYRNLNFQLMREVDELREQLRKYLSCSQDAFRNVLDTFSKDPEVSKDPEEIRHTDKYLLVEKASTGSDSQDEIASYIQADDDDIELQNVTNQGNSFAMKGRENVKSNALQIKLDELSKNLEEARLLNCRYREDQELQLSHQRQTELVCEQVEMEASRTILHLQEEVATLQPELNEKLCSATQENILLRIGIAAKEEELRKLGKEWERATLELTCFLVEGSKSLKDASRQIENIVSSFPQVNGRVSEHVERAARACIDKEETILHLQEGLEDAQKMVVDMELKLNFLKKATMAMNGFPQLDTEERAEVATHVNMLLNERIDRVKWLRSQVQCHGAEKHDPFAFLGSHNDIKKDIDISKPVFPANIDSQRTSQFNNDEDAMGMEGQSELKSSILDSEDAINTSCMDAEVHIAAVQSEILEASTTHMNLVQDSVKEIQEMRGKLAELKDQTCCPSSTAELQGLEQRNFLKFGNHLDILYPISNELAKMNVTLKLIEDSIKKKLKAEGCPVYDEFLTEANAWSAESCTSSHSTSGSDFLTGNTFLGHAIDDEYSSICHSQLSMDIKKLKAETKMQKGLGPELEKLLTKSHQDESMTFYLRKELDKTFNTFNRVYVHLMTLLSENGSVEEMMCVVPSCGLRIETAEACYCGARQVVPNDKVNFVNNFLRNCEEAHSTMIEADHMLNGLPKANESAKQLNGMCNQTSEEQMVERSCSIEVNKQLSSSICMLERENNLLLNETHQSMVEMASLEGYFLQMQREVEDKYRFLSSEVLSVGKEMLYSIANLRSILGEFCSKMMEKGFTAYGLCHCIVAETMDKISSSNIQHGFNPLRLLEDPVTLRSSQNICSDGQQSFMAINAKSIGERDQNELAPNLEEEKLDVSCDDLVIENLFLKKELERKEFLFKGLLFDFSLLQETVSNRKDMKDEAEKLILASHKVQHELELKTKQLEDLEVKLREYECHLSDTENALFMSNSNLDQAKETIDAMSEQNAELRMLLKDLYLKKSEAEEQLQEHKQVIKGLEEEIIHLTASADRKLCASAEDFENELRKVTDIRDQLYEEICSFNDKLEMAYALADEKEAIAIEARQESEASKVYAEQKEEEVKILEHSVEELEYTINVLEKKVHEMDEEVERHQLVRDSLELELQSLRHRLSTVEKFTDTTDFDNTNSVQSGDPMSRQLHCRLLELHEARNQIRFHEKDIADKNKEIKQCKEYISELVMHSEAQALQYQEKYKTLEAMVREVKENPSNIESAASTLDRSEKSSLRTRGSSSPFRCIASLVQQMNAEKDQELSVARLHIVELESLLTSRQKEVCMLNARLATAESMTHDVIRDLLGVKLDMTNYANLIEQHQVQKLLEENHQQIEELQEKEQEILNLKKQINNHAEETESCICEINRKAADMLAAQMRVEELKEQDELLSAQNEMLKMDKSNLLKKIAELDEMVKTLLGGPSSEQQMQHTSKITEHDILKLDDVDLMTRLAKSERLLSHVNDELAQYHKSRTSHRHVKTHRHRLEQQNRKSKA